MMDRIMNSFVAVILAALLFGFMQPVDAAILGIGGYILMPQLGLVDGAF